MPEIPTFETQGSQAIGGSGPPRADASAFMAPGQAIARAGEQLSDVANQFSAAYAGARRQADAAQGVANGAKELNDLNFNLRKLPDSQAAYQQYGDGAAAIIQKYQGGINDPLVQAHVVSALTQHATIQQELTRNQAFGVESSQRMSDQDGRFSQAAQELATATDPLLRASILDRLDGDAKSSAAAGWQTPDAASRKLSAAYRSAIQMKMESDPIGAQQLQGELSGRMTDQDIAHTDSQLKNAVPRRQVEDSALAIYNNAKAAGGSTAAPADADTLARAQLVRSGLIARGVDADTSTAIAARSVLESGARPAPAAGDGGASHGLLQWNKERLANYIALNGHPPEQGSLDEQLDFIKSELNGPESGAAATIAAAPTLDGKARAVSLSYIRPGLTPQAKEQEATNTVAMARQIAGQPSASVSDQIAEFNKQNGDKEPRFQLYGLSILRRLDNEDQAQTSMQRNDLARGMQNLEAAYTQGITSQEIPADDIRRLMPGARGQQLIDNLSVARQAGDLLSGVQYASPDQEQSARAALAIPGAIASSSVKIQNHQIVPPAGGGVTPAEETPDAMRMRLQVAARYDALLQQKHQALTTDPASYVATQPDVAVKLKSVDPRNPDSYVAALNASLAMQRQLGVPDQNVRVLTNGQVAGAVRAMTSANPATTDIGQAIDDMAKQYGDSDRDLYSKAFGELVRFGKLPPAFQIVGSMTEPGQVAARQDLIRAAQQDMERGGAKRLSEIVPPVDKQAIDKDLDGRIAEFAHTASVSGATGNLDLISNVRDAVKTLAYLYATQGQSGGAALENAANAVLDQKYDFSGTLRAPKGHMADAEALTAAAQRAVTPDSLAPVPGNPDLTPQQRAGIVATAAQSKGVWVPNEHDDGAVLLAPLRDGSHVPVIKADGTRVEVKWPAPGQPWPSHAYSGPEALPQ